MSWAQEMKNLVAEIKTSHRERTSRINEIKKDTRDFLIESEKILIESEKTRMADFKPFMEAIVERVRKIRSRVKRILGEYAAERKEATGYWASLSKKAVSSE